MQWRRPAAGNGRGTCSSTPWDDHWPRKRPEKRGILKTAGNERHAPPVLTTSERKEFAFFPRSERQRIKVQELVVGKSPLLWSCTSSRFSTDDSKSRKENKERLLAAMLDRFRETGKHLDTTSGNAPFSPHITCDRMGKPRLVLNGALEPSISFSHCDGMTWGALAEPGFEVGIDAARADEFWRTYPLHRVFNSGELEPLLEKTDDLDESAALMWSAKEAFVKALGCGFHLFSPLGVRVSLLHWELNSANLQVRLSETVLEKLTLDVRSQTKIASFRFVGAWVSVALLDRNCLDRTRSRFSCIRSDNCATL